MSNHTETPEPRLGSGDGARPAPDSPPPSNPPDVVALLDEAMTWVEKNQTVAMLGAFALGVFIGTMMRD